MVAANPNQNGNPNQDTGVKPHPERIARKLKKYTLQVLTPGHSISGRNSRGKREILPREKFSQNFCCRELVFFWIIPKVLN